MKRLLTGTIILLLTMLWLASVANDPNKTQAAWLTEEVTFSNQVVRLMQNHCQRCHHQDGHAPFPLMTYAEAYPYAGSIKAAVVSRRMPHSVSSVRIDTGCGNADTFQGPRRLTADEIAMIVEWVDAGAAEGNPADMPPPVTFDGQDGHDGDYGDWRAGEPDMKLDNGPNGFRVPGSLYKDFFRRFPIKTDYESDRYFTTFEVLAGTGDLGRQINVVHHVTLFIDPTCGSLEQEKAFAASNPEIPGPGFEGEFTYPTNLVGMWFPGTNPIVLQDGIGIKVPRGTCLVMEIHYTTWQPEMVVDITTMGLRWARQPVYKERVATRVNNEDFVIPAGASRHEINATKTFDDEITIYSLAPHMHQFGTDFVAEAVLPNGEKKCLIDVEYDFKHQGNYLLKQPIRLPAGTKINVRAFYENTDDFVRQLNHPPIDIPFGPVSEKEMCQITIGLTHAGQLLHPSSPTISAIRVKDNDRLIVTGNDLRPGAFIEINGKLLADTQIGDGRSYLFSPTDWQTLATGADAMDCCCASKTGAANTAETNSLSSLLQFPASTSQGLTSGCNCSKPCGEVKRVRIAVVNPDGGRSMTRIFTWRDPEERGDRFQRYRP